MRLKGLPKFARVQMTTYLEAIKTVVWAGCHVPKSSEALCWKILACEHSVLQLVRVKIKERRSQVFPTGRETSAALRWCCKGRLSRRTVALRSRRMLVSYGNLVMSSEDMVSSIFFKACREEDVNNEVWGGSLVIIIQYLVCDTMVS